MQTKFTSGTVIHLYLDSALPNPDTAKNLIRNIFENYKLPYISITPTFSTCLDHGYLKGTVYSCPKCGKETLVWSRVVGYLRPVKSWNWGKKQEFRDRIFYDYTEKSDVGD